MTLNTKNWLRAVAILVFGTLAVAGLVTLAVNYIDAFLYTCACLAFACLVIPIKKALDVYTGRYGISGDLNR